MNDCRMEYELFIRRAFGMALGDMPGRGADPAGLADADYFSKYSGNLNDVKIGLGYAVRIYGHQLELKDQDAYAKESDFIDGWIDAVMNAGTFEELCEKIEEFKTRILGVYFAS